MSNKIIAAAPTDVGIAAYFQKLKKKYMTFDISKTGDFTTSTKDGTNHLVLLPGYQDYMSQLYKEFNKNTIQTKDKVFFDKNSIYPRTTFNKYSKGARRVEIKKNATRIVINNDKIQVNVSFNYGTGILKDPNDDYFISISLSEMENILQNKATNIISGFNYRNSGLRSLVEDTSYYKNITKTWEEFIPFLNIVTGKAYEEIEVYTFKTAKEEETFQTLQEGLPLDTFILDNAANKYLNQFKTPLDEKNIEMLSTLLLGDGPNITIGLKLLENLNLDNSKPYLYTVLLTTFDTNEGKIRQNKVWNSVGIKNMRVNYNIDKLYGYNWLGETEKVSTMRAFYDTLNKKDKKIFKDTIEQYLFKLLKSILGVDVYRLIKSE